MIKIGIDSVEIERFIRWADFSPKKLSRIFTDEELQYSLRQRSQAPERLAARFAAKEAFYKALSPILPRPTPFLTIAKNCSISHSERGEPIITYPWQTLNLQGIRVEVSITHTQKVASAIVLVMYL